MPWEEIGEGLMDSYELRLNYAQMTGDTENAFRMREDGTEGYFYSDETIMRAMDELNNSRLSARPVYSEAMSEFGPRAGVPVGRMRYVNSPMVAYENAQEDLRDFRTARDAGDTMQSLMSLGSAASQGVSASPVRRMSAMLSLYDYLRGVER